jgi:hypothetical protein
MVGDYKILDEKKKMREITWLPIICIVLGKKEEIEK